MSYTEALDVQTSWWWPRRGWNMLEF